MDDIRMMILEGRRCFTCGKILKQRSLNLAECKVCNPKKFNEKLRKKYKKTHEDIFEEKAV